MIVYYHVVQDKFFIINQKLEGYKKYTLVHWENETTGTDIVNVNCLLKHGVIIKLCEL